MFRLLAIAQESVYTETICCMLFSLLGEELKYTACFVLFNWLYDALKGSYLRPGQQAEACDHSHLCVMRLWTFKQTMKLCKKWRNSTVLRAITGGTSMAHLKKHKIKMAMTRDARETEWPMVYPILTEPRNSPWETSCAQHTLITPYSSFIQLFCR